MSKTYKVECYADYADDIADGRKNFIVRENDRGYQAGDEIVFTAIDDMDLPVAHPINGQSYRITYVQSGWGIERGYVVLAIKPEEE